MGWNTGSLIFSNIIEALNNADVNEEARKQIYTELIPFFEDEDCDTLEECLGEDKAYDKAYRELNPEEEDEDYEEET